MDNTALVGLLGIDIEGGERLLKALDEADLDVRAALWSYSSDSDRWRLMVAFPLVDEEGPKKAYTLIQSELAKLTPPTGISLSDIWAVGPEHDLIRALREAARKYPGMISKKWFKRTVINGVFIEGAYVYRAK